MSGGAPLFWQQPLRYWRWAARERPALFWSCIIGGAGPVMLAVVPPIRHRFGDPDAKPIPMTYPIPAGPRKQLSGYDDDTEQ
ncbi:n19m, NADH-ubiquinone oxidoreductase 9.5 kDa subunit [Gnomoniopsis smithogilvyi]|uniref:N19m, NADH-ubiquinone oxidoreductase 9.5 kDa subunit n=1 Tax=Gnomoniopsis smithogilvyi TaxID=1191159 RepID=A0A9W8YJD7_9PEZI|nr:n19m, NADH-ubiquinone oxidoreductase 9.5 kDa subunit [Gnomoniopsis smithogilvyi]